MLKIRKADVEDSDEIAALQIKVWQQAYRSIMPNHLIDSMDLKASCVNWKNALTNASLGRYLVAESESRIVGFATFGPARDEDLDQSKCAEIVALNVAPSSWRTGIGASLLDSVLQQVLVDYSYTYLWVASRNWRALKFYETHGFMKEGATKLLSAHGNIEELRYVFNHN